MTAAFSAASQTSAPVDAVPVDSASFPSAQSTAPRCVEHDTDLEWMDGTQLAGYAEGFAPVGWVCPCDPGHPVVTPSQAARQPPASASKANSGLSAVAPETTNHPDLVTHHEET